MSRNVQFRKILVPCTEMRRYLSNESRKCMLKVRRGLNSTEMKEHTVQKMVCAAHIERAVALTDMCFTMGAINEKSRDNMKNWINSWIE